MQSALKLLVELGDDDVDHLLASGFERQVAAGTALLTEGVQSGSVFVILEGLFAVTLSSVSDARVAALGPGELVGEIAFLERGLPSATITAMEDSLVLEIKWAALDYELRGTSFAAAVYRSLAILNAQRLKERVASLGKAPQASPASAALEGQTWEKLAAGIEEFKRVMVQADAEALKHGGQISEATTAALIKAFAFFGPPLNRAIGDKSGESPATREEFGKRVQRELLPYVLLADTAERFYSKPRGYAGDFFTIELIYRNQPSGTGRLGPLLDGLFLASAPCVANRNRRELLSGEITSMAREKGRPLDITSLACGPAREVFDAFESLGDPSMIKATLLDIDHQALAFARERRDKEQLQDRMELIHGNLVYLAMGRHKLEIKDQDLIYSLGLIDYFNDRIVLKLLDWIHARLRPGGKVVLGNMYPDNIAKAFMDHVLDWRMTHRSEEDMNRLFEASAFRRPCTRIQIESARANIFAECIKE